MVLPLAPLKLTSWILDAAGGLGQISEQAAGQDQDRAQQSPVTIDCAWTSLP